MLRCALLLCLLASPALTAQEPLPETVEALEALARKKLAEAEARLRANLEAWLQALATGGKKAAQVRKALKAAAGRRLADGTLVAELLVQRFLAATEARHRKALAELLAELKPVFLQYRKRLVEPLLAALKKDPKRLPDALPVLTALGDPALAGLALPLLEHKRAAVREAAAQVVGAAGREGERRRLLKLLEDPDPSVRAAALAALRARPFPGLAAALADRLARAGGTHPLKRRILAALAELSDPQAVPPLLALLARTTDRSLERELVRTLGVLGKAAPARHRNRVERALKERLSARSETLALEAAYALAALGAAGPEVERTVTGRLRAQLTRNPRDTVTRLELAARWKRLGVLTGQRNYFLRAIREYRQVLREDRRPPDYHALTYLELAGCYARLGQFRQAAAQLERIPRGVLPLKQVLATHPDFRAMRELPQYRRLFGGS